jgi:hypothetical protein
MSMLSRGGARLSDGGQWLHEWGVDIDSGYPIDLQKLVMRDYKTGAVDMNYDMSAYEQKWGFPYYMLSVSRSARATDPGWMSIPFSALIHGR